MKTPYVTPSEIGKRTKTTVPIVIRYLKYAKVESVEIPYGEGKMVLFDRALAEAALADFDAWKVGNLKRVSKQIRLKVEANNVPITPAAARSQLDRIEARVNEICKYLALTEPNTPKVE